MSPIRLAVVDDSTFVRKALCRIFEREPSVRLVGAAASGEELLANLGSWRPEVITLDLQMPGMGGLATLDRIMAWRNVPVIILSTHSAKDAPLTIEALHHGAVDFVDKQQYSLVDFDGLRKVMLEKILHVAGRAVSTAPDEPRGPVTRPATSARPVERRTDPTAGCDLVVIGASTGGPPAIQQLFERLETPLPVPVVVVQHMPAGFTTAFASRLDAHLPFAVREPRHGERLVGGTAYIAAAGAHLQVDHEPDGLTAKTTRFPEDVAHRPSVDILFESAARLAAAGVGVIGVLLTGMGRDGAAGMAALARAGGYTLAQDEATCVVYGMPKAAVDLGAVREELPLPAISRRLNELLGAHRQATVRSPG